MKLNVIMVLLVLVAKLNLEIKILDVKIVFLHGDLKHDNLYVSS